MSILMVSVMLLIKKINRCVLKKIQDVVIFFLEATKTGQICWVEPYVNKQMLLIPTLVFIRWKMDGFITEFVGSP